MPEIGEEIRAEDIGKAGGGKKYVWVFCPVCEEERWVVKKPTLGNTSKLCRDCNIHINATRFSI